MTDAELRDAAVRELEQTTVSGAAWVAGGRKPGRWKTGMGLLAQIDTPDPPPPDPPPAGQGSAIRARWTRKGGAFTFANQTRTSTLQLKTGQSASKVGCLPGSYDGFRVEGSNVEIELSSADTLADPSDEVMSISMAESFAGNLQVYGLVSRRQGVSNEEHPLYIHGPDLLFAAVLAYEFSGYGVHGYGSPADAVITNSTFAYSKLRAAGLAAAGHKQLYVNCILAHNPVKGIVRYQGAGEFTVRNSCVWPKPTADLDRYTNCVFEDPGFRNPSAGDFTPTNPKLLTLADPAWQPPTDAHGRPYVRPSVGAVAA